MPYPDKLLADDEEVVAHLHPHALAVFWPVVRLLLVTGAASFGAALVPGGDLQRPLRLAVVAVALVLVLASVVAPLLRWRSTHYVVTTHRVLHRCGVLTRRGRDVALARITDVSSTQTLWERVIRAGTLSITSAGEGATVLRRVPGCERVQTLLHHMVEEDADRRAQGTPGHLAEEHRRGAGDWQDGWGSAGFLSGWDTGEQRTASFRTNPVP